MPITITQKAKKLAALQAKVAEMQKQVDEDRAKVLAHLHEKYGFADADELIKAIRAAAGGSRGRAPKKAGGRKKYSRITAEMRAKIKAALQSGKTGSEVAAEYGVSVPSVYNIKKASGLVKSRKTPKPKKPAKVKAKKPAKTEKTSTEEKPAETK